MSDYECPICHRPMMGQNEACSGSFTEKDHPTNVAAVSITGKQPPAEPRENCGGRGGFTWYVDEKCKRCDGKKTVPRGVGVLVMPCPDCTGKQCPAEPQERVMKRSPLSEMVGRGERIDDGSRFGKPPAEPQGDVVDSESAS